jgi:hypothetical protein
MIHDRKWVFLNDQSGRNREASQWPYLALRHIYEDSFVIAKSCTYFEAIDFFRNRIDFEFDPVSMRKTDIMLVLSEMRFRLTFSCTSK